MTTVQASVLEDKRRLVSKLLLERHRKQFPTLGRMIYLNYGVQGALPIPARDAISRSLTRLDELAPYSTDAILERREEMARARSLLARELGVESACVSLLENTSMGMNVVLWGTPWKSGDRIVMSNHEYPGVVVAIEEVAHRFDLEIVTWEAEGGEAEMLEALEPLLAPPTRMVVVSHVLWDTGRVLPLEKIVSRCDGAGAERVRVLVDGAQAVGVLPLDLSATGVDYYAFTGHKWWCGPEGAGGLYVRPDALPGLRTTFVGPRSLTFDGEKGFGGVREDAARFEVSSSCAALHTALSVAIEVHGQWGDPESRLERLRRLSAQVWQGLGELATAGVERLQSSEPEVGLIFFRVPDRNPLQVVRFLEARGALIRTIPHASCLRVSTHYLTLPEEIDSLLAALRELLQRPAMEN